MGDFVAQYYDRPFKNRPVINGIIAAAIFISLAAGILWLAGAPDLVDLSF